MLLYCNIHFLFVPSQTYLHTYDYCIYGRYRRHLLLLLLLLLPLLLLLLLIYLAAKPRKLPFEAKALRAVFDRNPTEPSAEGSPRAWVGNLADLLFLGVPYYNYSIIAPKPYF